MGKILKFVGVGFLCTIVDFLVYSLMVMVAFSGDTEKVGIAAMVSGLVATVVAYMLHSRITWKTRDPGKWGVVKFFLWNAFAVLFLRPILTWIFGLLTGLYEFAQMILPFFSYEFVESTGIYVLMTAVVMVLNFIFYEKIVFGTEKENLSAEADASKEGGKKVDMKRVRQAGKEKQGQRKAKK